MKAMILAAGLGTRLKPLTDTRPKALVEVDGKPMLERVIVSLRSQGFDRIVVNTHHFAQMVKDFLQSKDFGVNIGISDESDQLLDTGGGLVKASELLFAEDSEPVIIHNVDILCNADLKSLMEVQKKSGSGATLLVSPRESGRRLVFSPEMTLKGWHDVVNDRWRPRGFVKEPSYPELAFSGIYVVSREMIEEMGQLMGTGSFPVMDYFLSPDRKLEIKGCSREHLQLLDIGKPATLSQAHKFFS